MFIGHSVEIWHLALILLLVTAVIIFWIWCSWIDSNWLIVFDGNTIIVEILTKLLDSVVIHLEGSQHAFVVKIVKVFLLVETDLLLTDVLLLDLGNDLLLSSNLWLSLCEELLV